LAPELILASRSPQRRAILEQLGVSFAIELPDVEELEDGPPREVALENARRKAAAVAQRRLGGGALAGESALPDAEAEAAHGDADPGASLHPLVLGVDTVVVLGGRVFGKPASEAEARRFLEALSGAEHEVMSGIVVRQGPDERSEVAVTRVRFRALGAPELDWYLGCGEWRERAGGYAIQGRGAALVERIEGDYSNVVGLPVPALVRLAPELFR
jgi:septum formation protein